MIMKVKVADEMHRATLKGIDKKISKNDPSVTYQEWVLFWVLRMSDPFSIIDLNDIDEVIQRTDNWIDKTWSETSASRCNKKEIIIPWETVFDK